MNCTNLAFMQEVLMKYGFSECDCSVRPLGNGLINTTWLVECQRKKYVLQKINQQVFRSPEAIADNLQLLANYLKKDHPAYLFTAPLQTVNGDNLVKTADGHFRLFSFVEGSHTIDVVENAEQAREAAKQFGRFTMLLSGFDAGRLKITLPDFHNLTLRYRQFEEALVNGNAARIKEAAALTRFIKANSNIVDEFEKSKTNLKLRCIHHDTKISNVLFDKTGKGLCVIDLDTVMPGYFISDVGDMMRTYLSPVSEEESDFTKIRVRKEIYKAVEEGYLSEMGAELTSTERKYFHFSGMFMIYMQALRFLTDHISNDTYYGAKYEGHNFVRAGNQITLLQRLMEFSPG